MRRDLTAWVVAAALLPAVALSGGSAPANAVASRAASGSGINEVCMPLTQGSLSSGTASNPVVTLLTGDQVRLTRLPNGSMRANPVLMGQRQASPGLVQFTSNGDAYAVPDSAVPYLGSVLDPRLFDVSYLARAGFDDAHAAGLPVTVTYRGGHASASAIPGLRVTAARAGTATAVLTRAKALALGSLLAADWRTLHSGGRLAASDPLRNVLRISLAAGNSPPPPSLPSSAISAATRSAAAAPKYVTLTLNVIGSDGKPGTAVGWVQNLGDANYAPVEQAGVLNSGVLTGQPGTIKLSVPAGTYSVQFAILTPHPGTYEGVDSALVAQPQVVIHGNTTLTLDARTAKPYHVSMPSGVSTRYRVDELAYDRAAAGQGCFDSPFWLGLASMSAEAWPAASVFSATPTTPVPTGSLGFDALTVLYPNDLKTPSGGSRYFLIFPSAGRIPASLSYQVAASSLATVSYRMSVPASSAVAVQAGTAPMVWTRWGTQRGLGWLYFEPGAAGVPLGRHTDYWYSSDPSLVRWQAQALSSTGDFLRSSQYLTVQPGQRISQDWQAGPLVPSPAAAPVADALGGGSPATVPFQIPVPPAPAARQGQVALLNLQQGDNSGTHYQDNPSLSAGTFAFWRNGALAETLEPLSALSPTKDNGYLNGALLPMLPAAATYRLDWKLAPWAVGGMAADPVTSTDTDWTFHSGPADTSVVPASQQCGPDPSRPCTFLPLLFPRYDLPLNDRSQAKAAAPITITVTVARQQGEAAPAGVGMTVSASFDDGKTWGTAAAATPLGGNRFKVTIAQPALSAASGFASLRVTAHDNAGNSVVQTIIRAYGLIS